MTLQALHSSVERAPEEGFRLAVVPWETLADFQKPDARVRDRAPFFRSYLALSGAGTVSCEAYVYPWQAPCWLFFFPGQVWQWEVSVPPGGFVGVFDRTYLFEGETLELNFMLDHSFDTVVPLTSHLSEIAHTCERCVDELRNPQPYTPEIVVQQKRLFLLYISRNLHLNQLPDKPTENQVLVLRLQEVFAQHHLKLRTIQLLADHLHVTEKKLNLACKEVTGHTAKEWLDLMLFRMAESQIRYSRKPLSDIALELGFEEAAAFSRFVRRMCGMRPSDLRDPGGKG